MYSTILMLTALSATAVQSQTAGLTITFSPDELGSCASIDNSSSSGISIYTDTIPTVPTCLNLDKIFTANTTSGFQNSSGYPYGPNPGTPPPPNGVAWTTLNSANFNPGANYSHVRYTQINATGDVSAGLLAARYVTMWPFDDCLVNGSPSSGSEQFFHKYSCQTDGQGSCSTAGHSVRSVSIAPIAYNGDYNECLNFVAWPTGSGERVKAGLGLLIGMCLVSMIVLML